MALLLVRVEFLSRYQHIHTLDQPASRDVWVCYHHDLRHTDRLRAMLDIADAMLRQGPGPV